MPHTPPTLPDGEKILASDWAPRTMKIGMVLAVLGILATAALAWPATDGGAHLLHAYLLALMYFLSLGIGALFFVLLQHLTKAGWSVALRRVAELVAGSLPLTALLFVPILVSMGWQHNASLFPWVDAEHVAGDALLRGKAAYLNVPFFIARFAFYALFWTVATRYFMRRSMQQDATGDEMHTVRMQQMSAPGMLLFGLTTSFVAFDMLMSLTPHWFSTIFGVYFFTGSVMSFFATMVLLLRALQRNGLLTQSITTEHFHDLGKLMFGFVFFWGYIAFSQYMLIWYANMPEETEWFQVRSTGGWIPVSLALLLGHFVIPFLGLMSRHVKRHPLALQMWALWLLGMQWLDLYWLIMPSLGEHGPELGLLELACWLAVGGLFLAGIAARARGVLLLPVRDPRLSESLAFENV